MKKITTKITTEIKKIQEIKDLDDHQEFLKELFLQIDLIFDLFDEKIEGNQAFVQGSRQRLLEEKSNMYDSYIDQHFYIDCDTIFTNIDIISILGFDALHDFIEHAIRYTEVLNKYGW